jgi:hypothetical protein
VPEAGEFGARPHGAQDPAHTSVCFFCRFGALPGDLRTLAPLQGSKHSALH